MPFKHLQNANAASRSKLHTSTLCLSVTDHTGSVIS